MNDKFDRFGVSLSINVMKHGINKLLWLNTSITMYDEINCIFVACEAYEA